MDGKGGAGLLRKRRGFSLVEMLVVVVLLAIIIPAMLSSFTFSYLTIKETRMLELAKHVGQVVIERALSDPYPQSVTDQAFPAPLSNFRYSLAFSYDATTGRTLVTATVRYQFMTQEREYKTVAIRYAG